MKKKILLMTACLLITRSAFTQVEINETNFPDVNFRSFLLEQPYGEDGIITDTEMADITDINVYGRNISDLTGIKIFANLTRLWCSNNPLTSLDLSGLTKIDYLVCTDNPLTSLDVSGLTNLANLFCYKNQLTNLNVSRLTNLEAVYCFDNQLATIDLTGLTNLKYLDCSNNQFTSLDVSGLTKLINLICENNQLTSLNVSGLSNLEYLWCEYNQLIFLDLTGLNPLIRFLGYSQHPTLTLTGSDDKYSLDLELNNPYWFVNGLAYINGILTSTSSDITSSSFEVETGLPDKTLSGTLNLVYSSNSGISKTGGDLLLVAGYYNTLGVKLQQEPEKGIYIILYANGTTKKVMK